jgi:NTE family protein
MYTNIVFSGGAYRSVAFIGCVKYLEEHKLRSHITNISASSAGALFALLFAFDYSINEMKDVTNKLAIAVKESCVDIDNIMMIYQTLGLFNATDIISIVKKHIEARYLKKKGYELDPELPFIEFSKITGKNIIITGSCLTTSTADYFCVDKTPMMSVWRALEISISIPLIFKPIEWNDKIYIDGGAFNNAPWEVFSSNISGARTIVLNIVSELDINSTKKELDMFSYINSIVLGLLKQTENVKTRPDNAVFVNITFNEMNCFCFDFNEMKLLLPDNLFDIVDVGYSSISSTLDGLC